MAGALALTVMPWCARPQAARYQIDEARVVTLTGNTHPQARSEFDLGGATAQTRLDRMVLLLRPSAWQQAALDALVEAQQDPKSAEFHRWLTAEEYGARFGVSAGDLGKVTGWLRGHGFTVEEIAASQRLVVFSGTAGQVEETFHTAMDRYQVGGTVHLANSEDPQIPEALAGVVGGVVSLHDFRRTSMLRSRRALGGSLPEARPEWNMGGAHYLYPADYAAIYDLNPLYAGGSSGAGASIAIVGRSNINVGDVRAFRAASGLKAQDPAVVLDGADPGLVEGDQDEATLDVEWSGAVGEGAAVKLVAAASTGTTDGVDLAAAYIVNHRLAQVVSESFASCEQEMGATELEFYSSLWEQAASQGMTVLVASGDSGAAGCTAATSARSSEAGVNGLCSSSYSTCVGGTEFNEGGKAAEYWSASNGASQGSAVGYIPETVWNESGADGGTELWASGGGASRIYAQPVWQQGVSGTGAANGMRAVPDVAMTAAAHDGTIIYENGAYWIVSGTSASAPSFAGVMALVVEAQGGVSQGNANPGLYSLLTARSNPFHATPSGGNGVPGVAGFTAGGEAYNLATGLGSVDGAALVNNWGERAGSVAAEAPGLTLTAGERLAEVVRGGADSVVFSVGTAGGFTGAVTLSVSGLPAGVMAAWKSSSLTPVAGKCSSTLTLRASPMARTGVAVVTVTAKGDGVTAVEQIQVEVRPSPRGVGMPPVPVIPVRLRR
jgi:subtilase family serine protease